MEKKMKFIIFGLICFLVLSIFLNIRTLNSKQLLQKKNDELRNENTSLQEKVSKISRDYQLLEEQANLLSQDFERVSKEREELQSRYDSLDKQRQELVERLKSFEKKPEAPQVEAAAPLPTDAYWAGVLKEKTNLELQLENIRSELKTLQINNEQAQREKQALELELNNLKLQEQDVKRQLEYSQKQLSHNQKVIDNLTLELVNEKNDKLQINDSLKVLKNQNLILRRQLKSLGSRKVNLERKILQLREENARFEKRFNEMDILLKDKTIQIETLKKELATTAQPEPGDEQKKTSVELPPIVVRPQMTKPQTEGLTFGSVLAVNKENNFIIIDLGEDSGVNLGDTFDIYRDNNLIAQVEVVQVRKSISACDIKQETTPIKAGDSVK